MILQKDQEFLAHFGKKGMKWGKRNNKARDSGKPTSASPNIKAIEAHSQRNRNIKLAAGAATMLLGAAAVGYAINKEGSTPVASVKRSIPVDKGRTFVSRPKPDRPAIPPELLNRAAKAMSNAKKLPISQSELRKIQLTASQNTEKLGPITMAEMDKLFRSAGK